jgi:hypothetical protein
MLTARQPALLAAAVLLLLAGASAAAPASAAGSLHCHREGAARVCTATAEQPGGAGGGHGSGGGGGGAPAEPNGISGAYWSAGLGCWVYPLDPQPPAADPRWQGHSTGRIYVCLIPPSQRPAFFWADTPPRPDPAALARRAVAQMALQPPEVGATPLPGPGAVSLIGLPTWLWIRAPDQHTWGPITAAAGGGGIRVTATARVAQVVWDMGDGHRVTCTGPGTPWTPGHGSGDSPDCGYRYTAPGQRTITATARWRVDWSGGGDTGTLTLDLSGSRTVRVAELRAVVTG